LVDVKTSAGRCGNLEHLFEPFYFALLASLRTWRTVALLEMAQIIAGHADRLTGKLDDRRGQNVLLEDMERIRY
jgi:hypothetical protein